MGKDEIDYFKNFRINLQVLRISKQLSAERLAELVGLGSSKRITDIEYGKHGRGTPKTEEVLKIAKFFNVSTDDLIHKIAKIYF